MANKCKGTPKGRNTKFFQCPACGNDLPCTNNLRIRCCYCKTLIQPEGYKNKEQKAEIILIQKKPDNKPTRIKAVAES